jgi:hypothetical protein
MVSSMLLHSCLFIDHGGTFSIFIKCEDFKNYSFSIDAFDTLIVSEE